MKYLKYILIILLLLGLSFIVLGFIVPEVNYSSEIEVDKPVAEAWAVMNDETKLSKWLIGFIKSEAVSGTPGKVGSVSNIHFDNQGTVTILQETITKLVPNKTMAMSFTMEPMNIEYEMQFEERAGKTFIKSSSNVRGNGMIMKSMMALMKSGMQNQEDVNMDNLKNLINENTDTYSESISLSIN